MRVCVRVSACACVCASECASACVSACVRMKKFKHSARIAPIGQNLYSVENFVSKEGTRSVIQENI